MTGQGAAIGIGRGRVLFCSLSIEPGVGGMQRFDRRVVDVLLARAGDGARARPVVHVLFDHPMPGNGGQEEPGARRFGRARLRFLRETLDSIGRGSRTLLLGHILFLPLTALARLLRPRLRVVLFVHGIEVWGGPGRHRRRWYEPLLLRLAVDHVIAVSNYTADIMAARFAFPRQRIAVLPNAVDPLPVTATAERNGAPVVLVVARLDLLDRAKNVDQVIRAVAALAQEVPAIRLEIVGDGELRAELERLTHELGVERSVDFLGRVDDAALDAAYRRACVFALPSAKEGFGIVYLEAWQRGLPVIGAAAGGVPEVVSSGEDGLLVSPGDLDGLIEALRALLSDPARARRYAEAGMRQVESRYLHRHFEARLSGLLDGLSGSAVDGNER
jgi:glycosyltransferase involved in cell wall biosynthesis